MNQTNINSMQDVYRILNSGPEDSYELITHKYEALSQESTDANLAELKKAYKLISVLHGMVEHSKFNSWYHDLATALSKIDPVFELYDDNIEQLSIIDYMDPELFLDAYIKNYTTPEFSQLFYNDKKLNTLLHEANHNKNSIEDSLQRIHNLQ